MKHKQKADKEHLPQGELAKGSQEEFKQEIIQSHRKYKNHLSNKSQKK